MVGRSTVGGFATEWVYRHCHPDHKDFATTIEHSKEWGGRYNPAGEFGAIYVSSDRGLAIQELSRRAGKYGISVSDMLPRLLLTLYLRLQKVLDLTNADVREAWGATLEELTREDDYSRCQEIGRIARRDGYEAVRFPAYIDIRLRETHRDAQPQHGGQLRDFLGHVEAGIRPHRGGRGTDRSRGGLSQRIARRVTPSPNTERHRNTPSVREKWRAGSERSSS